MDTPGNTTASQDSPRPSRDQDHASVVLAEILAICDWDRDTESLVIELARSCGARGVRMFQHDDGSLREVASWPATKTTSLTLTLGLRERLLRSRDASSVRVCNETLSKTWRVLLPDRAQSDSTTLMFEFVAERRLLGLGFMSLSVTPPADSLDELARARFGAWLEPGTLRMLLLEQERELVRLRDRIDAGARQRLDSLTFDPDRQEIVGASGGLRQVMERVELVSSSDVPVLLFGETGSGKEVIARAIHEGSSRQREPFVRVNCGAIPTELIDSQLFGHERGSFTGATEQRKGWFERANGGTLFLDEVGELPLAAQVRLLRVLQDHSFERVGGQTPVYIDCRIIAATHRDLPLMVQAGEFREDLWYRLAVFPLVIPPLRERPSDIPSLARWFARRAVRFGLPPCVPSEENVARLLAYDWPGNVRELAAVIDRAAILGRGRILDIETALGAPRIESDTHRASVETSAAHRSTPPALLTLDEAMRAHIETVLTFCEGRIEGLRGAARVLDINPHTLRSRMRKLGIDWQHFRGPGQS